MSRFNPLSGAIRLALFASAASLFATSAFAQDQGSEAAEDEDQVLEELVITGSRIKSQTVTSSSPVTEIQREEFQFAGATRVEDLINQYPQLAPSFDSVNNNPSTGYATVDLRGLGPNRTLTLVNGQRLPPGPTNEARDISIIPAAIISRVDILTGGASAVYGSDAVAGVVNFILDTEFEGISLNAGYSGYQHKNENEYMQGLQTLRGFPFEDGNSGLDGTSKNLDLAVGSSFGDGAGHAMAWLTWRDNKALFQGQRDYASCALNSAGTGCGGSNTNAAGNFYFVTNSFSGPARLSPTGSYLPGYGAPYNYAPPNFFQRPDERFTFGSSVKYQVNDHFQPYLETMFVNRTSSVQIAESGAFFTLLSGLQCDNPLLRTACADLGIDPTDAVNVYIAKRNIEGGPRITNTEDSSYRFVVGSKGQINENWSYDVSFLRARTSNDTQGLNDFLTSRIQSALLGCPAGSFAGCQFYNVWQPNSVTAASANALAGVSFAKTSTELTSMNGYVTGDLGFGFASAGGENVSLVAGFEARREQFTFLADSNSAAGNFAGAGAAAPPINGETKVQEIFMESVVPVFSGDNFLKSVNLDVGYRYSDYDRSGGANTYKLGFTSETEYFRVRGGYNRAIRAPNINDLFAQTRVALFAGADPCSGPNPTYSAAQCANTGVSAAQYANPNNPNGVPRNPAGQNNQFIGGNIALVPEEADTWTLGFVFNPMENLQVAIDYYDIGIEDAIGPVGAVNILDICAVTGDPIFCSRIVRNPTSGDIFRGPNQFVGNLNENSGNLNNTGIDLTVTHGMEVLGGNLSTSFIGSYVLKAETELSPGNDQFTFDCAGVINPSCQLQEYRHTASIRYARDNYSVGMRWRYFGSLDFQNNQGEAYQLAAPGVPASQRSDDTLLLKRGGIGSYNYIDLNGSLSITPNIELTMGVNNIFDKEPPLVGVNFALNANAPGGYDQLGRFVFSNISLKF